jgi:hypothetical protein
MHALNAEFHLPNRHLISAKLQNFTVLNLSLGVVKRVHFCPDFKN